MNKREDYQEVVSMTKDMVNINTVNDNEKDLAQWIRDKLELFNIPARIDDIEGNRANIIGIIEGSKERKSLLLNGHLDTVPPGDIGWEIDPFSGQIEDGKIFGRGTADMKGGMAAMLVAMKRVMDNGLKLKGDLIFAGTAGEEVDSIGAHQFVNKGGLEGVGAIIVGEPSSCEVNIAEKGALWLEITTIGKLAHGAFPEEGINAIDHMHKVLSGLYDMKLKYSQNDILGKPTMNISTINGGLKTNTVPERCTITIDIRTVPGMEHKKIVEDIQRILKDIKNEIQDFNGEVKITNDRPAVSTPEDDEFVQQALKVNNELFSKETVAGGVNFYTDASVFLPHKNLPCILYGPGDASMAHQTNEYVTEKSLHQAVDFYYEMIKKVLVD